MAQEAAYVAFAIKNKVGVLNLDYLHKKYTDMPVTTENLQSLLSGSSDIIFEYLAFGRDNQIGATLIFAEGLTDSEKISESVIRPLNLNPDVRACTSQQQLLEMIQIGKVYAPSSVHAANMDELLILLFTGAPACSSSMICRWVSALPAGATTPALCPHPGKKIPIKAPKTVLSSRCGPIPPPCG